MNETKIAYFLKVGEHIVSQDSFLQERYDAGDHFPASGFMWICKNTEKTPQNYVMAVLAPQQSRFAISEEDRIETIYQTLVSPSYGWKEVCRDRTRSLTENYFSEPVSEPFPVNEHEVVTEKEVLST